MTERPHFSKSAKQLEALFRANKYNGQALQGIATELQHRTTSGAASLRRQVEAALGVDRGKQGTSNSRRTGERGRTSPPLPQPPPTPSHQTFNCRSCRKGLRVPVLAERAMYHCPTCKVEFETVFKDGVVQVVWVEKRRAEHEATSDITDKAAREILGVAPNADFPTIKAAWRKASQQYHPDKHQALPERLRSVAEAEMKRINIAYRFLEAVTASDF